MGAENSLVPLAAISGGSETMGILPERKKSVLATVREKLQANPDVFYAGEIDHYISCYTPGDYSHRADVIIAPSQPLWDVGSLNTFMEALLPDIPPTSRQEARPYLGEGISMGILTFDEQIGTLRVERTAILTSDEPDVIERAGGKVGISESTREGPLNRRTWVRLYPDPISASIVTAYQKGLQDGTVAQFYYFDFLHHWITPEQIRLLQEYMANPDPNSSNPFDLPLAITSDVSS